MARRSPREVPTHVEDFPMWRPWIADYTLSRREQLLLLLAGAAFFRGADLAAGHGSPATDG